MTPGGVLITRQGGARRIQTDLYDAVVDADGCTPSLRVDGVEFFKPGVSISRGVYFHQNGCETLPDMGQSEPHRPGGRGENRRNGFRISGRTNSPGRWKTRPAPDVVLHRLRPGGDRGAERQGRMAEIARRRSEQSSRPQVGQDHVVRRPRQESPSRVERKSGAPGRGDIRYGRRPSPRNEKQRKIVIETALATPDEVRKAAETAGTTPPTIPEACLYVLLDYQVVQRQTRLQGAIPIRVRVRQDFDRLEARVTGKVLDECRRASGKCYRRPRGRTRSTGRCRPRRAAGIGWRCGR